MNKQQFMTILKWGSLAMYGFFAYHLILIPLLLEYSIIGAVVGWGILLSLFFLIPKPERKQVTLFILLFLFIINAFHQAGYLEWIKWFYFSIIIAVVYPVARFYGKLNKPIVWTLITLGLLMHFVFPKDEVRLFNHFTQLWESPQLYTGEVIDYFPLFVRDINEDGKSEVITFGHRQELKDLYEQRKKEGLDPNRMPYDLEEEPLFLYVFSWNGNEMVRIPQENIDLASLRPYIPKDYIGFPYYVWGEDFSLIPYTQKQNIAEQMGQFGASPFYVMDMNLRAMEAYMTIQEGIYDTKKQFRFESPIQSMTIKEGKLIVKMDRKTLNLPTRATKIIDLIRTEQGLGFLLLSEQLELWTLNAEGELELTHVLTESDIDSIMSSEFIVADINHDGGDEILISSETSRIIRPQAEGKWEVLFTSPDKSLRFEDFEPLGGEQDPGIIALSKSLVRNHPLRYLTGFTYTKEGLEQDWKTFVSLINVRSADITGDGNNELVASIYKSHKVFVLKKHQIPIYGLLLSVFVLLVIYTIIRRVKYRHV